MRVERIVPGRRSPPGLAGAVLARDIAVDGVRWSKGRYTPDDDRAVEEALRAVTWGRSAADVVLTAGGRSTDPSDAFLVAVERLGGRVIRRFAAYARELEAPDA